MTDQRLSDQLRFLCRDRFAYEQLQVMLAAQQEMADFLLEQQKQQLEQQHQAEIDHFLASFEEEKREFILLLSYAMRAPLRQILDMTQLLMQEDLAYQHHDWLYTLGRSANRLVQVFQEAVGDLDIDLPEQIQLRLPMLMGGMPAREVTAAKPTASQQLIEPSIDTIAETVTEIVASTDEELEPETQEVVVTFIEENLIESITAPVSSTTDESGIEDQEVVVTFIEETVTESITTPVSSTPEESEPEDQEVVVTFMEETVTESITAPVESIPEESEPEDQEVVVTLPEEVVTELITESVQITDVEIITNEEESIFPILEAEFMENIISIAGKGKPALEFLLEVIMGYLNEAPDHMRIIRNAYTEKNISQFVRSICFLRADAEYLGGLELSHMCRSIEIKLEQEHPFPWHKISVLALEKCFDQTYAAIQEAHHHYQAVLSGYNAE